MTREADAIIRRLNLKPHPEGGHFCETFRDRPKKGRALSTAIYFLLKAGEASRWHRIDAVEIWHHYAGAPLELKIATKDRATTPILGNDLVRDQRPQIVVPAHAWQCARTLGDYTLVGCTVAPGFEFSGFEMAAEGFGPSHLQSISRARTAAAPKRVRSRAMKRDLRSRDPD